jgi:hypothetical protein
MTEIIPRALYLAAVVLAAAIPMQALAAPDRANSGVIVRAVPDGGLPVVARITHDGTIHLLYELNNRPMYAASHDGGATFSRPVPVVQNASDPRLTFGGDDMAVTEGGRVLAVLHTDAWKFKLPKDQLALSLAVLEPGKPAFSPVRNINQWPSSGYAIAAADERHLTLSWFSGKLYWNNSEDGGATFTSNAVIDPAYAVCECCTTRATHGANGDLAILYREKTNNHRDMYLVRVKKDGSHVRTQVSQTLWDINACPMTYFSIEPAGDGYIAAWPTRGKLYFTKLSADGKPTGAGDVMTDGQITMRSMPLALTNPSGMSLIAWRQQGQLHWQLYDAQNNPTGAPGSAAGASLQAAGVVDKAGGFVLFP